MILVSAKCPDCGAGLKIPEGSTSVVCEFCGGNILVTDVLGATDVMRNCMTLAYASMESKNYKDAYDHFNRAIEIDMKNPNAWFGKAVCEGMTDKFRNDSFGQMMQMFETSFNYASADKQANFKKNAAAEIVKVVRNSEKLIRFSCDLITFKDESDLSDEVEREVAKIKFSVEKTVRKAQEYDPTNADVTALLEEITSGRFFNPEPETLSAAGADKLTAMLDQDNAGAKAPANPPASTQTVAGQPDKSGRSGCSFVFLLMVMTAATTGAVLCRIFIL